MFNEIKEILNNDTTLILDILEDLECHDILDRNNEIRCSLPEGKNNTSIRIKKTFHLAVDIFSRHDFDDFEIGDIFSLVQYIRGCTLENSVKYICSIIKLEYNGEYIEYSKSKSVREIRRFKPKEQKEISHTILEESFLNNYEPYIVDDWVKEGIDKSTQQLFEVCIDKSQERWIIPIRDAFGNLITTKGRTYVKNFDLKGIGKYLYYPKMGFNDMLFGYNLTAPYIYEKDEIIIVEAEKSVMKAWAMNEKNFGASGKAGLNEYQIKLIIQMKCKRVVLAYDKDIGMDVIQKDIDALKFYKEVYYVLDKDDLLDKKDAPLDKGWFVWIDLYSKKKRGK